MNQNKFRAYAHTKKNLTFKKAWNMKEGKFNPIEPPKHDKIWDDWYEESQSYLDELLTSMEPEYLEEHKMIDIGIGIDGAVIHSAKDHVKEILSEPMRYTGFNDIHDKEIFEGDIMNFNIYDKVYHGYEVVWDEYRWTCRDKNEKTIEIWMKNKAIVGNIYENEIQNC